MFYLLLLSIHCSKITSPKILILCSQLVKSHPCFAVQSPMSTSTVIIWTILGLLAIWTILHIAVVSRYFLPKYIKEMFITKRCWLTRTRNRTQVYQLIKIHLITFQLVFHLFQEHYSTFVTISWRAALHAVIKHGQRTWLLCGIDTPPDQRCEPVVV